MPEEKLEGRDINFRQLMPWTELFRSFQVALDLKKLLLAAAGVLVMSAGWYLLGWSFSNASHKPNKDDYKVEETDENRGQKHDEEQIRRTAELARAEKQWEVLQEMAEPGVGRLCTPPWDENRGPNPYLLLSQLLGGESPRTWSAGKQVQVVLEPLIKFLLPVQYLLDSRCGTREKFYLILVLLWTAATWALFGGAITRMAAVQLTRKEKITIAEAIHFTLKRYVSFFSAPLFPLVFVFAIVVLLILFGILHMIPAVGDIVVDGLGWPLVILAAVVMAIFLVGLVGWPLMYATISVEGSDSFDALSRSYSYVYQCPWHYLWNCAVAIGYGCVLVFFVGFMGSLSVYLGKWAVAQTPFIEAADRDPAYLFIYAPESFGWRELMLRGSPYADPGHEVSTAATWHSWNTGGAVLVAIWVHLLFLMVVGFGYSYFWTSSTMIYLLMRRQVDETDLDEIYLEEDDSEEAYGGMTPAPQAPATTGAPPAGANFQMVDPPSLRPSAPPAGSSTPAPAEAPNDGNPPAGS